MTDAARIAPDSGCTHYQITIRGMVNDSWSDWFEGVEITSSKGADGCPVTILSGKLVDQAALRGVLMRLWDLNATLLAVQQVAGPEQG